MWEQLQNACERIPMCSNVLVFIGQLLHMLHNSFIQNPKIKKKKINFSIN